MRISADRSVGCCIVSTSHTSIDLIARRRETLISGEAGRVYVMEFERITDERGAISSRWLSRSVAPEPNPAKC
jgi:hypothetical protein